MRSGISSDESTAKAGLRRGRHVKSKAELEAMRRSGRLQSLGAILGGLPETAGGNSRETSLKTISSEATEIALSQQAINLAYGLLLQTEWIP